MPPRSAGPLATYEDLGYRDVFWSNRRYEDACDRIALRALLPERGRRLIEVGAGFGRLADEYSGFDDVVLLDSSEVHVAAARQALGSDSRYSVVHGDALALPYPDGYFDMAVCVRVLHHFADPAPLVAELGRVVRPGGIVDSGVRQQAQPQGHRPPAAAPAELVAVRGRLDPVQAVPLRPLARRGPPGFEAVGVESRDDTSRVALQDPAAGTASAARHSGGRGGTPSGAPRLDHAGAVRLPPSPPDALAAPRAGGSWFAGTLRARRRRPTETNPLSIAPQPASPAADRPDRTREERLLLLEPLLRQRILSSTAPPAPRSRATACPRPTSAASASAITRATSGATATC